jgi:hypothetical protein
MKSWIKEIIWFVGTLVVAYLIFDPGLTFNLQESTIDINVHDTYFVMEGSHILILITVALFFVVYLTRILVYRLKNRTVNILFLIANFLQVLSLIGIINLLGVFIDMAGTTVYPPLSGPDVMHSNDDRFKALYHTLIIVTVVLAVFDVFVLYKTIILYKKAKQANLN